MNGLFSLSKTRAMNTFSEAVFQYLHPMEQASTDALELAARFVDRTRRNIYLTGKAGTGKTTFLHALSLTTYKRFVVVAPTGIAALNAKGVTIHSQFLLPPGTFVPDRNYRHSGASDELIYTPNDLVRKHPLNEIRRKVLREIDLLIIDEVSMLRADLLDAIDYRMKHVRSNYKEPFGGIQVLMIGDLYQLPPVVKDNDRRILSQYYNSAFFFEAHALKEGGFTTVELDKVFRQTDGGFISLLNNLRNNLATAADIDLLNSFYRSEDELEALEEVVTLTTHNYKAEQMNREALENLQTEERLFSAEIEGDFPQNTFPVDPELKLKIGAQIMFIRNDSAGNAYFNGKLATVKRFDDDDNIYVELAGEDTEFKLRQEIWVNKRYEVNDANRELEEKELGSFKQYPVKLAWAITVHKSQGLTFERAIIDVGQAFAPGQVYVALSRLRSLDGLILRTRIHPSVIATDHDVVAFSGRQPAKETLPEVLNDQQHRYLRDTLRGNFDFDPIINVLDRLTAKHKERAPELGAGEMKSVPMHIREGLTAERTNLYTFRKQIDRLLHDGDAEQLTERLKKAAAYYDGILRSFLADLLVHITEMKRHKRVKGYINDLTEVDQLLSSRREAIGRAAYIARCILEMQPIEKLAIGDEALRRDRALLLSRAEDEVAKNPPPVEKKKKRVKGDTFAQTWSLYLSGKTIDAIAKERELKPSTIDTHIYKGVQQGIIPIERYISPEGIAEVSALANKSSDDLPIGAMHKMLNERYSYNQIRAVLASEE